MNWGFQYGKFSPTLTSSYSRLTVLVGIILHFLAGISAARRGYLHSAGLWKEVTSLRRGGDRTGLGMALLEMSFS